MRDEGGRIVRDIRIGTPVLIISATASTARFTSGNPTVATVVGNLGASLNVAIHPIISSIHAQFCPELRVITFGNDSQSALGANKEFSCVKAG